MHPTVRSLPAMAAAVVLAAGALAAPKVGSKAPEFSAKELTGKSFRLSQFRAKSPVIVNFFSTTWGACREEYPHLSELQKQFKASGLKVVSVSIDDGSSATVKKFVAKMKPAFKVVHDPSQKSAVAYDVSGIPANFVIGRDGKIIASVGYDLPALKKAAAQAVGGSARASR